jgi:hypothetical protein
MIQELDLVVLTRNLPGEKLEEGDIGTVVLTHQGGAGYEVEFATLTGNTLAVVTVSADDIRPIGEREIAHVRKVA